MHAQYIIIIIHTKDTEYKLKTTTEVFRYKIIHHMYMYIVGIGNIIYIHCIIMYNNYTLYNNVQMGVQN